MAQTGVPFGEVYFGTRLSWYSWKHRRLHHNLDDRSKALHAQSEVSGRRLWGWVQNRFKRRKHSTNDFFTTTCPLVFMEESGRNRTPDKLSLPTNVNRFFWRVMKHYGDS